MQGMQYAMYVFDSAYTPKSMGDYRVIVGPDRAVMVADGVIGGIIDVQGAYAPA